MPLIVLEMLYTECFVFKIQYNLSGICGCVLQRCGMTAARLYKVKSNTRKNLNTRQGLDPKEGTQKEREGDTKETDQPEI